MSIEREISPHQHCQALSTGDADPRTAPGHKLENKLLFAFSVHV